MLGVLLQTQREDSKNRSARGTLGPVTLVTPALSPRTWVVCWCRMPLSPSLSRSVPRKKSFVRPSGEAAKRPRSALDAGLVFLYSLTRAKHR